MKTTSCRRENIHFLSQKSYNYKKLYQNDFNQFHSSGIEFELVRPKTYYGGMKNNAFTIDVVLVLF